MGFGGDDVNDDSTSGALSALPRFLSRSVTGSIEWPTKPVEFEYARRRILALPVSAKTEASLHIDIADDVDGERVGATLFNEILSRCVWADRGTAKLGGGISGTATPVPISRLPGRRTLGGSFLTAGMWPYGYFSRLPKEPRRALAIFREGVNLRHDGYPGLAVMSFYRLLEMGGWDGMGRAAYLAGVIEAVWRDRPDIGWSGSMNGRQCTAAEVARMIYKDIRGAAVHATSGTENPDDAGVLRHASTVVLLMEEVADRFIVEKFAIDRCRWAP